MTIFQFFNRKAEGDQVLGTVVYIILVLLFFIGMFYYVSLQRNGAAASEDFYAKEISKVINFAHPGDQIVFDVQTPTEIAAKSGIKDSKEIFNFDNTNKQVCVKLSAGIRSCYSYFNNVNISDWKINYGVPKNMLIINIAGGKNAA